MSENSEFYSKVGAVLSLEEPAFSRLLDAFGQAALERNPKEHLKSLAPENFGLQLDQILAGAEAGISYFDSGYGIEEVEEKSQALASKVSRLLKTRGEKFDHIQDRLVALIKSFQPVIRTNKIRAVMFHDERVFGSAIITPQIRPFFKESETEIDSFIALFNCKLSLFSHGKQEEMHISLDLDDVEALIETLELAKEQFEITVEQLSQGTSNIITSI